MIDIDPAWLSDLVLIGNVKTSKVVAQLPNDLVNPASIIVDHQMMIFGGRSINKVPNSDIIIFNVVNNNVSTLPSVFESTYFGQKTYLLSKGDF